MKNQDLTVTEDNKFNNDLNKIQCYIFYFFMFSFAGWLLETFYSYLVLGHFTNRGFFYGPICPIYGCGALMLIIFLDKYKNSPIKLFLYSIIVFSIFEYAIGYGLDALYNLWLWDYRTEFLNLNGRICLFYSLGWGVAALAFNYLIFPILKKIITFISSKIPTKLQLFGIRMLCMIFVIDVLYSFIEYSSLYVNI